MVDSYKTENVKRRPLRFTFHVSRLLPNNHLPLFHELDPRTTRVPRKIHSVFAPDGDGGWQSVAWED